MVKNEKGVLTLSAWVTAQDVNEYLSSTAGLNDAVNWCKQYGVTKVYLEAFGRGLYADRNLLVNAKNRFLKEGFEVQGGVTTTKFGNDGFGNGWNGLKLLKYFQVLKLGSPKFVEAVKGTMPWTRIRATRCADPF
jgi:hypothetical protein